MIGQGDPPPASSEHEVHQSVLTAVTSRFWVVTFEYFIFEISFFTAASATPDCRRCCIMPEVGQLKVYLLPYPGSTEGPG